MQRSALGHGDEESRRAGRLRVGNGNAAGDLEGLGNVLHYLARFRVTGEIAVGNGDAQARRAAFEAAGNGFERPLVHGGIGFVEALHGIVAERQILDRARQWTHVIEARDERERAVPAEATIGRLEAEQPGEGRWDADRAVGVGAKRQRHEPAGDRGGRAARRATRHVGQIVRVTRGAVMGVLPREVIGVFAHVEGTDADRTGRLELLDQGGIGRRRGIFAVDLRASAGNQPLDVEQILDAERHAGERQLLASLHGRVDGIGLGHGAAGDGVGEGTQAAVIDLDARHGGDHDVTGARLPRIHRLGDVGCAGRRFHAR